MKRFIVVTLVALCVLDPAPKSARAQESGKTYRIGILNTDYAAVPITLCCWNSHDAGLLRVAILLWNSAQAQPSNCPTWLAGWLKCIPT